MFCKDLRNQAMKIITKSKKFVTYVKKISTDKNHEDTLKKRP